MGGLTSGDFTEKYWFGSRIESDWKVGSPFKIHTGVADKDWQGKVLQCDPPRLLSYKFRVSGGAEHFTRVVFQLEQHGPVVKLTLTHDELDEKDVKFFTGYQRGLACGTVQPQEPARRRASSGSKAMLSRYAELQRRRRGYCTTPLALWSRYPDSKEIAYSGNYGVKGTTYTSPEVHV